jgi:hypothetical protein
MKQSKYGLLVLVAIAVSGIIWLGNLATVTSQPTVKIKTEPPLEQVIPDDTVVKFQLQAIDSSQQPFNQASVGVRILTPAPTPWFTSDFPIVEGRELLKLEAIAPEGNLEFDQVLPIRGNYTFEVAVTPQVAGAFEPFEESLTVKVPENAVKYRNLVILAVILLVVGFGSGWLVGGDRTVREGEIAPHPVRILLSGMTVVAIAALLIVNVSAEIAEAGSHKHIGEITSFTPAMEKNEAIQVELSGDNQAVVGKLATQTVTITSPTTGEPITDVQISLQSVALESDALMFAYQTTPNPNGQFTWEEQFFDGAPHSVTATVMPLDDSSQQFTPVKVSHEVEVEGIAPPLSVRFISLLYFTLIFVVGLSTGFSIRKSQSGSNT